MPTAKGTKTRGKGEYSKTEALSALGLPDTDEGFDRLKEIIGKHGLMPSGKEGDRSRVYVRTIQTKHGPAQYFDRKMIEELAIVLTINERRNKKQSLVGVPHGTTDDDDIFIEDVEFE